MGAGGAPIGARAFSRNHDVPEEHVMNKKTETNEKASRKAGKILRQLDEAQLEKVAGAGWICRTCGLINAPDLPTIELPQ
jgi:rubrerythrin